MLSEFVTRSGSRCAALIKIVWIGTVLKNRGEIRSSAHVVEGSGDNR